MFEWLVNLASKVPTWVWGLVMAALTFAWQQISANPQIDAWSLAKLVGMFIVGWVGANAAQVRGAKAGALRSKPKMELDKYDY